MGQSLRDGLSTKYKSATKFKKQRKPKPTEKTAFDAEKAVHSNRYVRRRIDELRKKVEKCGDFASDASIVTIFSRANSDILESIKKDRSMLQQYEENIASTLNGDICGV